MMNAERLIKTFVDLCRIPSPSGREGRVAEYVKQWIKPYDLTVQEDDAGQALNGEAGNLIIQCPAGKGNPIFLAAHLDTVPVSAEQEVPVIVEDGRVHTGGICPLGADDKAGVAVALETLACAVESAGQTRPLEVVFTVQEELGALGSGHLDKRLIRASQGFVLDGETQVYSAIRQAPYKLRFLIEVQGRSAHAAIEPEKGIHAIRAICSVVTALEGGRLDASSISNFGFISGGGQTNIVPAQAELLGEVRSLDHSLLLVHKQGLEETVHREVGKLGASAKLTWEELYNGYYVPDEAECIRLFNKACRQVGQEPVLLTSFGGGDTNHFNNRDLTCIVFGLGMEAIHSPDEYMLLERLQQSAALLQQIVLSV
jgi:tripeptide aminopeptidase